MEVCGLKPLSLSLLFFMIVGLSLFVFGTVFLVISPPKLDPQIEKYNAVVDDWNAQYRANFDSFKFNLTRYHDYSERTTSYVLDADLTPDKLHHDVFQELRKPKPLKYMLKQANIFPDPIPIDFSLNLNLDVAYRWTGRTQFVHNQQLLLEESHTVSLPVFVKRKPNSQRNEQISTQQQKCTPGFLEDGKCYYAYALKSVCLKLKQTGTYTLALDHTYGGVGCSPGDQLIDGEDWPGANYRFVQLGYNETNITDHMSDLTGLEVSLRSGRDPFIYANNITNGSLNFIAFEGGRTPYISLTRGFIGFGSVALGGLFFLPSIFCCMVLCCRAKTRHLLIDNMREEHHMLLQLSTEKQHTTGIQNWSEYLFPSNSYNRKS